MSAAPRIAVVDDEMIVAKDLESSLRRLGYEVPGTAPSGEDAVTLACTHKPDLVLMDIRLRGELDGIEAARQIQHQLDVPIVYVTAFADEATLARARETRPYGYLVKPVHEAALSSTISTALHRHQAERQARASLTQQRALLDKLGHLLWTAREDGRADYFNQHWFDYTGLTQTASRGYGWVTALHPADMRQCLDLWKEAVRKKEGFELVCSVMGAEDKRYRRHLMRVVLLPDAPGGLQWLATLTGIHDYELRSEASRFAETGTLTAPTTTAKAAPKSDAQAEPAVTAEQAAQAEQAAVNARSDQPAPKMETAMDTSTAKGPENFRDRFCAASLCAPPEFADRVFLLTVYFHVLPVALLLWPWRTRLFAADFALIEEAAGTLCGQDVQQQLELKRQRTPAWLERLCRGLLRCRISTRRLAALMVKVMGRAAQPY